MSVAGDWVNSLAAINAFLNMLSFSFLVLGYVAIKKEMVAQHKVFMLSALSTSALFLISYLTYHYFHGDTKFAGVGMIKMVYFFILISHVLLSFILLPLILITLYFIFKGDKIRHKKIAVYTFPIWSYVSLSGVLIFFLLNN